MTTVKEVIDQLAQFRDDAIVQGYITLLKKTDAVDKPVAFASMIPSNGLGISILHGQTADDMRRVPA